MIGVDTNILLRAFLQDDPKQSMEAREFLLGYSKKNQLFVSSYSILECAWFLNSKGFTRQEIYNIVMKLLDTAGVTIGQREVVLNALEKYIAGKADFGDYMIMSEGEQNKSYQVKTFNKKFQKELAAAQ